MRPVYANEALLAMSQWDLTIDFRLVAPEQGTGLGEPRQVARIMVSPMHAKALVAQLADAVRSWEQRFGPLPDAAQLLAAVGGARNEEGQDDRSD
jgi:hypothetical protein